MRDGDYADSQIIKLRKLHRGLFWRLNLENDAVPIRKERVYFSYRDILDGKARMLLPDHFTPMPETLIWLRYPSENRPQLILSGKDPTDNIGVSCVERNGRDLQKALVVMREAIRETMPESVFYDTGSITAKNCTGYWFEYKSFTINDEAYNLQFLLGSEQAILLGVFNCSMRFFEDWRTAIIKSLAYTEMFERRPEHNERLSDRNHTI